MTSWDDWVEDNYDGGGACQTCDGEGVEECDDRLMCHERDCDGDFHTCPNCGGTARSEDQTWW